MPFQLYFLPSFERCFKKLGHQEKNIVNLVIQALHEYFELDKMPTGYPYLFKLEARSYRLVFKKLRGDIWEAYIESRVRILTRLEKDKHFIVFAGNHDQVQQFLKEN